jgi:hypothetical protein
MLAKSKTLLSRGGIAAWVFIASGLYLFISHAGLSSLVSLRAAVFFVIGTFVAVIVIGISVALFQRNFGHILAKSITNPLPPQAVRKINLLGAAILMIWQIVITVLVAKLAYAWLIYFAI